MDEDEAWSMIDSMLDDDSPVSCDPAHSRDVYQVAIDELTNGGRPAPSIVTTSPPRARVGRLPGRPCGQYGGFRGTRCQRGSQ